MKVWATAFVLTIAALFSGLAGPRATEASAPLVACADFDGDGVVSQADVDLQTLGLGARLGEYEYMLLYDSDTDGVVTQADVDATTAQIGANCPLVDTQVTQATLAVSAYRDMNVALADGFVQGTQNIAGHGVHYIHTGRLADNVFDITKPEGLNYTVDGRLIAVYYIVPIWIPGNETMPDGVDGSEDMWHYHDGLCQWQTGSGPAVAENVPQAECLSRPGGIWWEQFGWMLHLWSFQHNPMGRFMMHNPDITIPLDTDGDSIPDVSDNCLAVPNPGQENADAAFDNGPGIPGDDVTIPGAVGDAEGDACETDGDADNDGLPDADEDPLVGCGAVDGTPAGHPDPTGGDATNDDNGDGDPAPPMGSDAADNGPSWDTDGDGVLDGVECSLGHNPRDKTDFPTEAECGGAGDTDGDGLQDAWETCGWGTDPLAVDSDGDGLGDCVEAADVDGNGVVDFGADTIGYAKAALLPAGSFGKTMDFDIDKNGVVDFGSDVIQIARFALFPGLCN